MGWAWAVTLWLASGLDVIVEASPDVPDWVRAAWQQDGEALAAAYPLDGPVTITGAYDEGQEGRLDLEGRARGEDIVVWLYGSGWREETETGRWVLRQNLSHEYVHAVQAEVREPLWVPEILYEGIAEALSLRLLTDAGVWADSDAARYARDMRQRCDRAARRGPIAGEVAADAKDAIYGCGFALVAAAIDAAAADPFALHVEFVEAIGDPAHFGRWARERFGGAFLLQTRAFLRQDFSGAGLGYATRGLAAGRL